MTDDTLADHPLSDQLIRTFAAVAEATPITDRRDELIADLDVPVRTRRTRWRSAQIVPIAAALLLVGAAVVAVAARGRDDGPTRADQTGVELALGPYDDPTLETGWYLPADGWSIRSVEANDLGGVGRCPCRFLAAARLGQGDAAVLDMAETEIVDSDRRPPGAPAVWTGQPWDLDADTPVETANVGGRVGLSAVNPGDGTRRTASVDTGGRRISVFARHVAEADLLALLDAWADAVDAGREVDPADLPLPDGFVTSTLQEPEPVGTITHVVVVTAVEDATGAVVEYQLVPTGHQRWLLMGADTAAKPDGGAIAFAGDIGGPVAGAIGGAVDVTMGRSYYGRDTPDLDRDALIAFRDGLREVSTEEWRTAIRGAARVTPTVLDGPSLFDPPVTY